jgi:hypothetical protein
MRVRLGELSNNGGFNFGEAVARGDKREQVGRHDAGEALHPVET